MATWPTELPQELSFQGFASTMPTGSVRVDMDAGPPYQRQRFTAAPEPISGSIWVDADQYQVFMNFWRNSTAHGSLPFDWKHPITGVPVQMQFDVSNPPRISAKSGALYQISMSLEVLP